MQMRSQSTTNPSEFLVQVISQTADFLDDEFNKIYEGTSHGFFYVSLSVLSYEVETDSDGNGFAANIDLTGTAFFEEAPPQIQVGTVLSSAFQQRNQDFLQTLIDSSDPFLQDIDYAIVEFNGIEVSNEDEEGSSDDGGLDAWLLALIVGASTFVTVFCMCMAFICWAPSKEGSGKGYLTSSKHTTDDADEEEETEYLRAIRGRSISPVRSITSQASSNFTYNPKSTRSSGAGGGSFLAGPTEQVDIEAWQRESTINKSMSSNVPFGDISAIESKKDLSLIEEGDSEEITPLKIEGIPPLEAFAHGRQQTSYLSRKAVASMEQGDRRKSSRRISSKAKSNRNVPSMDLNGTAQDVIADLNDLSYQIDQYRGN
jgi:hypothetical protein